MQTIRKIFNLALSNSGTKDIAMILNRDGYRTSTGKFWGKTTVHKVLNNEAYCGTLVLGGKPSHPSTNNNDPPIRVENAWPAIIEPSVFKTVQEKMIERRPRAIHPRTLPSFYLLSGLLFCSCGHAMIGRSAKSHQFYYYTCNANFKQGRDSCNARSLPKDKLERLVIEQIREKY